MTSAVEIGGLALIAALMAGGNAYVFVEFFPRSGGVPNLGRAILIAGLLFSSFCLWLAVAWAVTTPSVGSWIAVFLGMNTMMVVVGVWFIAVFLRAEEKFVARGSVLWPVGLSLLVVANELFMGASFVAGLQGAQALVAPNTPYALSAFTASVNSVWFFWTMLGNLVLLIVWLPLPPTDQRTLIGLSAIAAIGPWVLWDPGVGLVGVLALGGLVILQARGAFPRIAAGAPSKRIADGTTLGILTLASVATVATVWPAQPLASLAWALGAFVVLLTETSVLSYRALQTARPGESPSLATSGVTAVAQ